MGSRPYDCAYCGALFPKASEHASHVTKVHDRGFVPRSERTFMAYLRCWRCAADMPRDENNKYSCTACGFILPDKASLQDSAELAQEPDRSEYSKEQP